VTIAQRQETLEKTVVPQFNAVVQAEEEHKREIAECERRQTGLLAKQSRGSTFHSQEERDEHLREKIGAAQDALKAKKTALVQAKKDLQALQSSLQEVQEDLTEREEGVDERRALIEKSNREFAELKGRRDTLQNERNQLRRKDADDERRINNARQTMSDRERELLTTTSKAISQGLESVRTITSDPANHITGVHGPLIELIEAQKQFETPTDITGGNALFNVVVDSDKVASDILRLMNARRLPGRVTFLPLNKLKPKQHKYPESTEVLPLVKTLTYDEKFKPAVDTVFGRTLVCRNLSVASSYSKQEGWDGITLEGDKVHRKGALTGGYIDRNKNKISIQSRIHEAREELGQCMDTHDKLKGQMTQIDQEVTVVLGEIEKVSSRKEQVTAALKHLRQDLTRLREQVKAQQGTVDAKTKAQAVLEADITHTAAAIATLQEELGTDLNSQLDGDEQAELNSLGDTKQQLRDQILACIEERGVLEQEKNRLESELNDNLLKKRKNLLREQEDLQSVDGALQLQSKEEELEALSTGVAQAKQRLAELHATKEQHSRRCQELTDTLDQARTENRESQQALESAEKTMEKILNKRRLLLQKKEENMRHIRDLGSLPVDAAEKYKDKTEAQLYKKLKAVKSKLKKYSHVNKKALDQYVSFSEQRDALQARQADQEKGDEAIHRLIEVLDNQKDEAIQLTFKQVAKYFGQVFKELVPHGHGSLVMLRRAEDEASQAGQGGDSEGSQRLQTRIEQFTGVAIKVNFTGRGEDTQLLQQLSGGQRTLVALTLIFAIQQCDPAPFYLFDEIDQALDAAHRAAVAAMIYKRSRTGQYITTTFRPELLVNCDKVYGVSFADKVRWPAEETCPRGLLARAACSLPAHECISARLRGPLSIFLAPAAHPHPELHPPGESH